MTSDRTGIFELSEHPDKDDPALIGADTAHLAEVAECLRAKAAAASVRRDALMASPERRGRGALDRDEEIHRLGTRLATLRRARLDACLGSMTPVGDEAAYIGRIGLADGDRRLLVDWRASAAEPFFAATPAHPMGLVSRRRYRWVDGRIRDYWDEALIPPGPEARLALDDDSAFLAGLSGGRSGRMRDVLATLAADQDAIIRAGSAGALIVEGGPGTGKTVVALHRAAYLMYADRRLSGRRGGILVVGPHRPYLDYIADVLPSLGEEGVVTCTIADLVPEGSGAAPEPDPRVAALKASGRLASAIEPAVALYEEPPTEPMVVETEWFDVRLRPEDWADAFGARDPAVAHNESRDEVWEELIAILAERVEADDLTDDLTDDAVRQVLRRNEELRNAFGRAWPILDPAELVSDLWSVPAYLRRCAPWLSSEEIRLLRRDESQAWTSADLPMLDAARLRVGDPQAPARARRREAALAERRRAMDDVVEYLLDTDDDPESPLPLLRRDSIRTALVDDAAAPATDSDRLAGPFAHVVVDEAQELADAEWQMLLRRCPSRSFTIVGDRAQARQGFAGTWERRLRDLGFTEIATATLSVNYRTPAEIMAAAEPVIRAAVPDAAVPVSIRGSGVGVQEIAVDAVADVVEAWLEAHAEGTVCVIARPGATFAWPEGSMRVRRLDPVTVKGLEFDLVVVVDPESFGDGVQGAVDRYVAMTRATRQLILARAGADRSLAACRRPSAGSRRSGSSSVSAGSSVISD